MKDLYKNILVTRLVFNARIPKTTYPLSGVSKFSPKNSCDCRETSEQDFNKADLNNSITTILVSHLITKTNQTTQ